ncbi:MULTISPECIES: hypothetical protein [unclassified Streptomyces]|uniref:hypothetical protein n=1 Tax=unclassified Streptomyces TaxID=2593676 RepID=UPI00093E9C79|nr:hypothetical protein [Streptomyces sp. TSRI0107]OKJ84031.1 hypothetical protein AMK31_18095 [Streptomyces sp. TSRI0107]
MRSSLPDHSCPTRSSAIAVSLAALISAAALVVGAAAPQASAAPSAAPLPLPVLGSEPLITEGVTIEGPLINTLALPTLR